MSKANEIWVCCKNGRVLTCTSTKAKAIAEIQDLAKSPGAEVIDKKDGSIMLKGVLRFRATRMPVK